MPTEVERLRKAMRVLSSTIAAFAEATTDYRRLIDTVVRHVADVIPDSCIMLVKVPDGELVASAIWDPDPELRARLVVQYGQPLGPADPLVRARMQSGQSVLYPALDLEAMRPNMTPALHQMFVQIGLRGTLMVPMRVQGEPFGVVTILRHRKHARDLDELDLELAKDFATHAAIAVANARAMAALREREELRRAQAELAATNRFLDAIIENIPDMVFVKDADRLAFTRFNRAGEELIGLPREALVGKTDYDFFPAEQAMHFQAKDRETLNSKKLIDIREEPIETAHGRRWLYTKKVPIFDEAGTPRYLLGISQDITEKLEHERALVAAKVKAEEANKELEAFSYSVAHDLRAPLRAIDGFSQALLEDYDDRLDVQGAAYLRRVREQAQRMATLIDDLLALSRVTRHTLALEPVDLGVIARETVFRLQRAHPTRTVGVTIAAALTAHADARMMAIAFDNLIGNAWKFTSRTDRPQIEVGQTFVAGERRFFVRDNGAGFDPQYVHKLFGVFQRLHTENEFPGTGIGLATVARIILRHRGRVWADGEPGKGATFFFTLGESETP